MRQALINTIIDLAKTDPRIVLLTGDLGYLVVEPFIEQFPDRFFNIGVAEQNMVGIATGLAEAGYMPFIYSIVTFATLRGYEFIRNGPIHHNLPVRIVGVGGGFEYAHNGASHHGLEDIGVMRVQPGISIFAPADCEQTKNIIRATYNLAGPIYYRLGKDDRVTVPGLNGNFELGRLKTIREGKDLLIITLGNMALEAEKAARILESKGIGCSLAPLANISPVPSEDLLGLLQNFRLVFTLEAHCKNGGIGSLVAELIAERSIQCKLLRFGIDRLPDGISGSQEYLYDHHGLSAQHIVDQALKSIQK